MSKGLYSFLLILVSFNSLLGQNSTADSLSKQLPYAKDTSRVNLLIKLATRSFRTDPTKALSYSEEALQLAKQLNYPTGLATSHRVVGLSWFYNNDHTQAIEHLTLSAELAMANQQWNLAIQNFLNLAGTHSSVFGNYVKAMEFYTKAMEVCESQNIQYKIYDAYSGIAYVYFHQQEHEKALEYYTKARLFLEIENDKNSLGTLYQNIGELYASLNKMEDAETNYEKSLNAFREVESKGGIITTLVLLSEIHRQRKDTEKALRGDLEALEISKKVNYERAKFYVFNSLGKTYFVKNDYAKSNFFLEKAATIATKAKMNEQLRDTYLYLALVSNKMLLPAAAYHYQKLHTAYADSVRSKERTSQLAEMEVRFESERKEKENQLLKKDNDLNKLYAAIASISFLSVGVIGFLFFNRQRLKNRSAKVIAESQKIIIEADYNQKLAAVEMKALKAQMNPHFIFNSLNSINRYIVKSEPEKASMYLTKFSKLIRLILENSNYKITSLEQELTALKLYIDLEVLRYNKKFSYSIEIKPDLNPMAIGVPSMIIQPFVENAIWHGLLHKDEPGNLKISIERLGSGLQCIVSDNGIGRKKAAELKSKSIDKEKSYGMKITQDRLNILNGDQNGSSVEIVDIYDELGNAVGTRVIIKILSAELEPEF